MKRLETVGGPLLFLSAGLAMAHYPILLSGFRWMESDFYDARFVNYLLEHAWRWLTGAPHHESLWSPPFFFPASDVGAYSEILLGAAPPYFLARAGGLEMDSAFQLWILVLGVLNFVSLAAFARRAVGLSPLAAAVVGALFAFAGPRLSEASWGHYQVHPQVWTLLALLALAAAASAPPRQPQRLAAACVGPCLALQLWSGFYLGWFVGLALPFGVLFALAWPDVRAAAWARRRLLLPLLGGGLAGLALLAPMASRYLGVAGSFGMRSFVELQIPTPARWLYLGDASVLYGTWAAHPLFSGIAGGQALGLGPLTTLLALIGLVLGRRHRWLGALAFAGLALVLLATRFDGVTAWLIVFDWVPGGAAIRAVTRVVLLVLIPAVLGVGVALDRLRGVFAKPAHGATVVAALGLFCLAEQAKYLPSFDKADNRAAIREIAERVSAQDCRAFLYVAVGPLFHRWKYSIDAMWASLASGVPTLNGYSGFTPPGWDLDDPTVVLGADEARIEAALARWVERNRLDPASVCRVTLRPRHPAHAS